MKYTENYKLLMPDENDFFDVLNDNKNMDMLDTALKELKEDGANHAADQNNPHNVTAAQVGASNPNLLINGDFKVWQRGEVFESNSFNFYTADRWFVISTNGNDTVKVEKVGENGGIRMISTIDSPCLLWYRMEENDLARLRGKTVTLSYSKNGVILAETFVIPTDILERSNLISIPYYHNDIINWAKLELGSVATHFVPRSYGEELAACQRYYKFMDVNRPAIPNYADRRAWVGFNFNDMRIPPTVSGTVTLHHRVGEIKECDIRFGGINPKTMNIEVTATENLEADMWLLGSVALDAEIY